MQIRLLIAPYDSGHYNERMGKGPLALLNGRWQDDLTATGHTILLTHIQSSADFSAEIATAFELHRLTAEAARSARRDGGFPLLLAGNCNICIGPIIGAEAEGVIWFDAHGDFNTPETTPGGFFDGMAMAVLTGRCWKALAARTPGFRPTLEANIIHIGGRDFDPEEEKLLRESSITLISPETFRKSGMSSGLDELATRVRRVHLHFDFDVLDPSFGQANPFPTPNGLSPTEVVDSIHAIRERFTLVSASLSAYDPSFDGENKIALIGSDVIKALVE